jgi:hypothetical protein
MSSEDKGFVSVECQNFVWRFAQKPYRAFILDVRQNRESDAVHYKEKTIFPDAS